MTGAAPAPAARRPYVTPALVVHGNVQTLTQTLATLPTGQVAASFLPPGGDVAGTGY